MNLQDEIKILLKNPDKAKNDKISQDNNLNHIDFLKHFYKYHTEKLKYRKVKCKFCHDKFATTVFVATLSFVELKSVTVATTPYFKHTAPLTYSL